MNDLIKEIRGNKVELQGNSSGIQIYKALDHSAWYVVKDSNIIFDLFPVTSKQDGKPAILTEFEPSK